MDGEAFAEILDLLRRRLGDFRDKPLNINGELPLDLELLQLANLHGITVYGQDMRISEAASTSGLSIETIRYYEKLGLLPKVRRGSDGRRDLSAEDIEWLVLLSSLRETGMPMEQMRHFAQLYQHGHETLSERKAVLLGHAEQLHKRRAALDRCAELLAYKLKRYDEMGRDRL